MASSTLHSQWTESSLSSTSFSSLLNCKNSNSNSKTNKNNRFIMSLVVMAVASSNSTTLTSSTSTSAQETTTPVTTPPETTTPPPTTTTTTPPPTTTTPPPTTTTPPPTTTTTPPPTTSDSSSASISSSSISSSSSSSTTRGVVTSSSSSYLPSSSSSGSIAPSPTNNSQGNGSSSSNNMPVIVGAAVGAVALLALAVIGTMFYRKRQRRRRHHHLTLDDMIGAKGSSAAGGGGGGGNAGMSAAAAGAAAYRANNGMGDVGSAGNAIGGYDEYGYGDDGYDHSGPVSGDVYDPYYQQNIPQAYQQHAIPMQASPLRRGFEGSFQKPSIFYEDQLPYTTASGMAKSSRGFDQNLPEVMYRNGDDTVQDGYYNQHQQRQQSLDQARLDEGYYMGPKGLWVANPQEEDESDYHVDGGAAAMAAGAVAASYESPVSNTTGLSPAPHQDQQRFDRQHQLPDIDINLANTSPLVGRKGGNNPQQFYPPDSPIVRNLRGGDMFGEDGERAASAPRSPSSPKAQVYGNGGSSGSSPRPMAASRAEMRSFEMGRNSPGRSSQDQQGYHSYASDLQRSSPMSSPRPSHEQALSAGGAAVQHNKSLRTLRREDWA